jgi:hypothetical protein
MVRGWVKQNASGGMDWGLMGWRMQGGEGLERRGDAAGGREVRREIEGMD